MDNSILRNCGITAMSIDITYNCNFRCRHCFNRSGEHCFGERELTDEELMKIIVEVADMPSLLWQGLVSCFLRSFCWSGIS